MFPRIADKIITRKAYWYFDHPQCGWSNLRKKGFEAFSFFVVWWLASCFHGFNFFSCSVNDKLMITEHVHCAEVQIFCESRFSATAILVISLHFMPVQAFKSSTHVLLSPGVFVLSLSAEYHKYNVLLCFSLCDPHETSFYFSNCLLEWCFD